MNHVNILRAESVDVGCFARRVRSHGTKEGANRVCLLHSGGRQAGCAALLGEAQDADIETIKVWMARCYTLQSKFLEHAALQCGICTPGFIMASKALLEKHPNPDEATIRYWLAGNLCRCTGYDKIVRAVQDAAAEMSHPA